VAVIKTFRAKNYGCLKDVTVELTPLHAFIGPNDSGKSTLLHGMRTVVQFAGDGFERDEKGAWQPFDSSIPAPDDIADEILLGCGVDSGWYAVQAMPYTGISRSFGKGEGLPARISPDKGEHGGQGVLTRDRAYADVALQLERARLVRFDPDALRTPSGLIPETAPVGFYDDRGLGLAGVYFAIRNRDDGAFSSIVQDVRKHFPTIKGIRVKAVTRSEVVLEADLASGAKVEAKRMSEGLLYYLAFSALRYLDKVSLLLVEEPENGLHPARIVEVMRILRAIVAEGTQVIMATHSPLVINEMQPDEVSVVTRTEAEGTKVTLMKDTANFAKRSTIYALGELWLSFADGDMEERLVPSSDAS
jgi:predicted ATPase